MSLYDRKDAERYMSEVKGRDLPSPEHYEARILDAALLSDLSPYAHQMAFSAMRNFAIELLEKLRQTDPAYGLEPVSVRYMDQLRYGKPGGESE